MKKPFLDIVKDIVCNQYIRGFLWNKLFRHEIIEKAHLRFHSDIYVMEDKLFCLEYMNAAHGEGVESSEMLYVYDEHVSSVTSERYKFERYKTGLVACEEILKLPCICENSEIEEIQKCIYVKHCVQISRYAIRKNQSVEEYKRKSYPLGKIYFKSPYISYKQKLGWIVLQFAPSLLKIL